MVAWLVESSKLTCHHFGDGAGQLTSNPHRTRREIRFSRNRLEIGLLTQKPPSMRRAQVDPKGGHIEADRLLDGVERAAEAVGGAAIPDRKQQVRLVEDHPPGLAIGFVRPLAPSVEFEGSQCPGPFGLDQDGVETGRRGLFK